MNKYTMGDDEMTNERELELTAFCGEHCALCDAPVTVICEWCGALLCDDHAPKHICTPLELAELEINPHA